FGIPAEEIKAMLEKYGLKVSGTHTGWQEIAEHFEETVAYHKIIGNKNIIIPGGDFSDQKKLDALIALINEFQPKLAAEGITLGFHNHFGEFLPNKDGSCIEDQLICRTGVQLEIDTYWAHVAGTDPVALLERLKDRVRIIHIRDGVDVSKGAPLGKGVAPVAAVYRKAAELGMFMVVENGTGDYDSMTGAKMCIEYLKAMEK
ncbi:MAG: sugar phosphate isomerase/epimerase, partial [Oscillospiraceae bacterium]|nr:sugar phosphate isomerase/epimerase [Oscillospiraceae bacterium]